MLFIQLAINKAFLLLKFKSSLTTVHSNISIADMASPGTTFCFADECNRVHVAAVHSSNSFHGDDTPAIELLEFNCSF